ncbi:hypothetical protein NSERUTF1_1789 [Nocardia seriolae]|nr:hypothetical protein NSERUTF1_1789 [Nocardia seriolae]
MQSQHERLEGIARAAFRRLPGRRRFRLPGRGGRRCRIDTAVSDCHQRVFRVRGNTRGTRGTGDRPGTAATVRTPITPSCARTRLPSHVPSGYGRTGTRTAPP